MLEGEAQSFYGLNSFEISFPVRQLCEHWQPCPSSSLEINLFPAVLALRGKPRHQPSPMGALISRMLIIKAKPYTVLKEKKYSLDKAMFFFSFSLYFPLKLWLDRIIIHWENIPQGGEVQWNVERLCNQADPRLNEL